MQKIYLEISLASLPAAQRRQAAKILWKKIQMYPIPLELRLEKKVKEKYPNDRNAQEFGIICVRPC